MRWVFGITIWGVLDEVVVHAPSYSLALEHLGEELSRKLTVELFEVAGETKSQRRQIIPSEHKTVITVLPSCKQDRLPKSARISQAIKHASEVWNG